jgi:23S rRNA (cytosine1962-C5)-methyltransferase
VNAPAVTISQRGADRLRAGHLWVYRSDVDPGDAQPGDLVRVVTSRERPLGWAFFSSASQIALRVVAPAEADLADERRWLAGRLREAAAYRESLPLAGTAWRVVYGESDRLPGLVVDRYGNADGDGVWLVVQTLTQAMDRRLSIVVELLADLLAPSGILTRNDPRVRRLEGLDARVDIVHGDVPERIVVAEGDVRLAVDLRKGQKTGLFLDQRENHAAAARYARGRALDAFAYTGGFALAMARRCERVVALDASADAVTAIRENAALNALENVDAQEANVFDELRELQSAHASFDTIVLDPPAFAKSRASVERAVAGYKEINLRALKLLAPGGHLVTCSCSYHVNAALFRDIVASAAADARVSVTLVESRTQAQDHPILLGVPETEYLKCLVVRRIR